MTNRTYQLVRFVPDPLRGEGINVAVVGFSPEGSSVLVEMSTVERLKKIAPHVASGVLGDFISELRAAASEPELLKATLAIFNPRVQVQEERALSSQGNFKDLLADAYRTLVAPPSPRRSERKSPSLARALETATQDLPTVRALMLRSISVHESPEVFGLPQDFFGQNQRTHDLERFDVVLPNCTRVVALRAFHAVPSQKTLTFLNKRKQLGKARDFFGVNPTSKKVITGALVIGADKENEGTLRIYRDALVESVDTLPSGDGPAVFNMIDAVDKEHLEHLARVLKGLQH